MKSSESEGLGRLSRAIEVYFAWKDADDGTPFSELLEAHPGLEELLIGMREEEEEGAAERKLERSRQQFRDSGESEEDFEGRRLGGYVLGRRLGRGAMGIVHEARDPDLGRQVAVKLLPSSSTTSPAHLARFRREASLIAQVEHESVVKIIRVGFDEGLHWFAMELVQGVPLSELLTRIAENHSAPGLTGRHFHEALAELCEERGLPVASPSDTQRLENASWDDTVAQFVLQLCRALHHAHGSGVIHRDVKPSNILVRTDGRPVLTDFGLAREEALPSMTQTGDFAGTPYYVAPEQVIGRPSDIDRRSDIFSLGVTLYELLTLERPFDAASTHGVLQAILTREPRDPTRYRRIHRDLVAICYKAIEKERQGRYSDAEALAQDLESFLQRRPVRARRVSAMRRFGRWAQREPARAGLLFVAVPLVAGLLGFLAAWMPVLRAGIAANLAQEIEPLLHEGYSEIFEGDHEHAKTVFGLVLEKDPDNVQARAGLAITLLTKLEVARVRRELENWECKTEESDRIRRFLLIWALGLSGKEERASRNREELGDPRTSLEAFVEGMRMIQQGHVTDSLGVYEQARDLFQRASLLSDKPQAPVLYQLAHAAGHVERPMLSRRIADALLRRFPERPAAMYWAGFALQHCDVDRALDLKRQAAEACTSRKEWLRYFRRYLTGLGHARREYQAIAEAESVLDHLDRFSRASIAYIIAYYNNRLGQRDEELEHLKRAIEADPEGELDPLRHAEALRRTNRPAESVPIVEELTKKTPADANAWSELVRAHSATGAYEQAFAAVKEGLRHIPNHIVLLELACNLARRLEDYEFAEERAKRLIQIAPRHPIGHWHLGYLRLVQRRYGEGAELLEAAVRFSTPGTAGRARANLARCYKNLERYSEAVRACDLSLKEGHRSAAVYFDRAYSKMKLGQSREAITDFEHSLRYAPHDYRSYWNIGACYDALLDYEASVAAYEKVLEYRPDERAVHRYLIGKYMASGDKDKQLALLKRWLDRHPEDAQEWYRLGVVWLMQPPSAEEVEKSRDALLRARKDPAIAGSIEFAYWWARMLVHRRGSDFAIAWYDQLFEQIDDAKRRERLDYFRKKLSADIDRGK